MGQDLDQPTGPQPDAEQALVTLYAPAAARDGLDLLWRLDRRLGMVWAAGTDPMLAAVRLAWWRDALAGLATTLSGEPLLQAVATGLLPRVDGALLAGLAEGWGSIDAAPDDDALVEHGRLRGGTLFAAAARLAGQDGGEDLALAGAGWALVDLAHGTGDAMTARRARAIATGFLDRWSGATSPALRFLGALAMLARRDAGVECRRQGAPSRLLRIAAYRAIGR